jgi:hypothetical protein
MNNLKGVQVNLTTKYTEVFTKYTKNSSHKGFLRGRREVETYKVI